MIKAGDASVKRLRASEQDGEGKLTEYENRRRVVKMETACILDSFAMLEARINETEASIFESSTEISTLEEKSKSIMTRNVTIRTELNTTNDELEMVSNRSLDFVARIKASRHSKH